LLRAGPPRDWFQPALSPSHHIYSRRGEVPRYDISVMLSAREQVAGAVDRGLTLFEDLLAYLANTFLEQLLIQALELISLLWRKV
jgi:hypothetical protein